MADDQQVVQKFISDYERGQSPNGAVTNNNRPAYWQQPIKVGERPDPETVGAVNLESGHPSVSGGLAASASNLATLFERISQAPEYIELFNKINQTGDDRNFADYGHEGDLSDLEIRAGDLADSLLEE